jgi:hypothetical protein
VVLFLFSTTSPARSSWDSLALFDLLKPLSRHFVPDPLLRSGSSALPSLCSSVALEAVLDDDADSVVATRVRWRSW